MNRAVLRVSSLFLILFLTALAAPASSPVETPQDRDAADRDAAWRGWAFGFGGFDYLDDDFRTDEAGVEYRFRPVRLKKFWRWKDIPLTPMAGVSFTSEDAVWGYAGLRYDWHVGASKKWVVTPSLSVSFYDKGDHGKDLGGHVQFRSAIEVARQVSPHARVGVLFYHLSNSRLEELNPGSESLLLVWSLGR